MERRRVWTTSATARWPGEIIVVRNTDNLRIAEFSVQFLVTGGITNWDQLGELIQLMVRDNNTSVAWRTLVRAAIDGTAPLVGGQYVCYRTDSHVPLLPYSFCPPAPGRMGDANRIRLNPKEYNDFRRGVIYRDKGCIVTGLTDARVIHLMTPYRMDLFNLALYGRSPSTASPSSGIALSPQLQSHYFAGELAFLPVLRNPDNSLRFLFGPNEAHEVKEWVIQFFLPPRCTAEAEDEAHDRQTLSASAFYRQLHGQIIGFPYDAPLALLARAHYLKCAGQRFATEVTDVLNAHVRANKDCVPPSGGQYHMHNQRQYDRPVKQTNQHSQHNSHNNPPVNGNKIRQTTTRKRAAFWSRDSSTEPEADDPRPKPSAYKSVFSSSPAPTPSPSAKRRKY